MPHLVVILAFVVFAAAGLQGATTSGTHDDMRKFFFDIVVIPHRKIGGGGQLLFCRCEAAAREMTISVLLWF